MRRYELMLLLRPDLEDDRLQAAVEKVTRAIVNAGGSLSKVSPWGKRRLAYEIKNFRDASYFLIHFDIQPSAVREIERGMLISEEILRHLVTLIEHRSAATAEDDSLEEVPAAVEPERAAERQSSVAAEATAAESEDRAAPSEEPAEAEEADEADEAEPAEASAG